jgi:hypothetical protein
VRLRLRLRLWPGPSQAAFRSREASWGPLQGWDVLVTGVEPPGTGHACDGPGRALGWRPDRLVGEPVGS